MSPPSEESLLGLGIVPPFGGHSSGERDVTSRNRLSPMVHGARVLLYRLFAKRDHWVSILQVVNRSSALPHARRCKRPSCTPWVMLGMAVMAIAPNLLSLSSRILQVHPTMSVPESRPRKAHIRSKADIMSRTSFCIGAGSLGFLEIHVMNRKRTAASGGLGRGSGGRCMSILETESVPRSPPSDLVSNGQDTALSCSPGDQNPANRSRPAEVCFLGLAL
jgi:hypothetical protein